MVLDPVLSLLDFLILLDSFKMSSICWKLPIPPNRSFCVDSGDTSFFSGICGLATETTGFSGDTGGFAGDTVGFDGDTIGFAGDTIGLAWDVVGSSGNVLSGVADELDVSESSKYNNYLYIVIVIMHDVI